MKDIILIGGGGHCKSVIDTIKSKQEYNVVGILDLKEKMGHKIDEVEVIGTDDDLYRLFKEGVKRAFLTLGSIGDTKLRRKLYLEASSIGYSFPNIIDKTSIVSNRANLGCGNFIAKGVIVNIGSKIKDNCIINTGVIVEHDCRIGSFCHLGPGATMSGNVVIGEGTHIGTNSTIIQNIEIGKGTIIGAGSVVVRNIDADKKAYGNPCKEVRI